MTSFMRNAYTIIQRLSYRKMFIYNSLIAKQTLVNNRAAQYEHSGKYTNHKTNIKAYLHNSKLVILYFFQKRKYYHYTY